MTTVYERPPGHRVLDRAFEDIGLSPDEGTGRVMHDYFSWATRTSLGRYPADADDVPHGLPLPRWSWNGLVEGHPA